ncbi:MAG: serine/threonine protein kinase [Pontiellaceae bacterium]|nr:serine/threonine protein kinase [Pontiellaceae bacterium]
MNKEFTERTEDLFCAAFEIRSDEERAAFIEEACAGDEALRSAVLDLLKQQPACDAFFDDDETDPITVEELTETLSENADLIMESVPEIPDDHPLGESIGPYLLLKKIGGGGIGNVYLAEQKEPVRRRVALKAIKAGMDTQSVIARFEAERQVLAMMEHPNIARVFDAGETASGRPYFVMELVDGVRITTYCDEQKLDIQRRLQLFIQVSNAILHAHQKGIIHRDIKPSNVLITRVDGKPAPKVIDFGVAKATRGQLMADRTVVAFCEPFVGTPVYMSPEQSDLVEMDVDMRSDIYSLGILLYEMLVGTTPFSRDELLEGGLLGMRRILRETEPLRPSAKFHCQSPELQEQIARCRQTDARRLETELCGELDWIVMKAIEKDRERRYNTVDALTEDVQRYLNNEPVSARPPSRAYQFRKLVRRNKGLFVSIAAVGLTLLVGLGTSLYLYARERAAHYRENEQRMIAEVARAGEAQLRKEAEARENITQAAVLINRERYDEAEALVEGYDLPVIKPSLEARDVFFQLASRRVLVGEWEKGAEHMLKFARAVQVDESDLTDEMTRGLLCVVPALVVAGRMDDYRDFAQDTIEHFLQTPNPIAADHVLRICTVCPVEKAVLDQLTPFADLLKNTVSDDPIQNSWAEHQNCWQIMTIAFYEYRIGDFEQAASWARKSLRRRDNTPSRIAGSHIILGMALHQMGQHEIAESELAQGETMLNERLPQGISKVGDYGDARTGYWHDWMNAYILLEEARSEFCLIADQ